MSTSTTKSKQPKTPKTPETPETPTFMPLTGFHGPDRSPHTWPDATFTSIDDLRAAHQHFLGELENLQTLEADVEALGAEKGQLIAQGARESRQRLLTITSELSAGQELQEAARDRSEAAERTFRSMLLSAWQHIRGRAAKLRQPLIEEREKTLLENPTVQTAVLPGNDKAGMVRAFAESWPPLRQLEIEIGDKWAGTLRQFEDALKWLERLEKDPSRIESEHFSV